MRRWPARGWVGAAALFASAASAALAALACHDEPSLSSFALSVEATGEGTLVDEPDGRISCTGPANCGTFAVDGTSVSLRGTPKAGFELAGWTLDGAEMGRNSLLLVQATTRGPHVVVVRFAPLATDQDGGIHAGPGHDGGAHAPTFRCGRQRCDDGTVCCVGSTTAGSPATAPSCTRPHACAGLFAECARNSDCPATSVCCFDGASLQCAPAAACAANPSSTPLCGDGVVCDAPKTCRTINVPANIEACLSNDPL